MRNAVHFTHHVSHRDDANWLERLLAVGDVQTVHTSGLELGRHLCERRTLKRQNGGHTNVDVLATQRLQKLFDRQAQRLDVGVRDEALQIARRNVAKERALLVHNRNAGNRVFVEQLVRLERRRRSRNNFDWVRADIKFFDLMRETLLDWHTQDPVDMREIRRCYIIATVFPHTTR